MNTLFGPTEAGYGSVRAIYAMTANGAFAIGSSSTGIGDDTDAALLAHARSWADCVLVGSQTVKDEDYSGAVVSAAEQKARIDRGQAPVPPIAVPTNSLDLDPAAKFFTDTEAAPLLLTSSEHRPAALLEAGARILACNTESPHAILQVLREQGYEKIMLEGGPGLFAQFMRAELVDVAYITVAPRWTANTLGEDGFPDSELILDNVASSETGCVFLRYRRALND
ncbi:pyrimidine reductase family protein [Corynebacterium yudongzhengii]|uniref:Pyrimidine reductase family protein n=1 Tax=Corynebacterium yudongzhengii TaxID=2080740 RepID=A0A2U1T4X7_9CORY|nr:dihydrofolate reductase family protein [Corynebacterium yudongzhengii]AWB81785.1 pyrimidine reductase family protein [Corynebacterium yudongzhengii]PWC01050.1 pyrimidine reductase family protein [Corynebacterium yudongzhengii]